MAENVTFDPYLENFFIAKSSNPLSLSCVRPSWKKMSMVLFFVYLFKKEARCSQNASLFFLCLSFDC